MQLTTLHLAKQNFKFSSAHFLIFDAQHAERLHGHNYQVKVDITVPTEEHFQQKGYFVDFNEFKKYIKLKLDQWDEMVLLPKLHADFHFEEKGESLHVNFRDRYYVFPKNEVCLLAVTNTSVEQLSKLLAQDFYQEFKKFEVQKVRVTVEETRGQGASTVYSE